MNFNKQYKNSVFSLLFSDPEVLRGLYAAIEGVEVAPDTPVSINTLTDVVFMDQINDLSFILDDRLIVLLEHQSTINPNMPLRLLMYIARALEKIIDRKKTYAKKLVRIPRPEFIVLYNGTDECPDQMTLKLSDAFKEAGDLLGGVAGALSLELEAKVYNINPGHNEGILKKCGELAGYSVFVDRVRSYARTMADEKQAFKAAINDCIEHNILREFLETHASEVANMLLTEWKLEEALEVEREEGREEGLARGREEAKKEDAKNFLALGVSPATVAKATGLDMDTIKGLLPL
jgi:predicted transposase YdaD